LRSHHSSGVLRRAALPSALGGEGSPRAVKPGKPARFDSEYQRRGTAHVLMAFEPLAGWRRVSVSKHRGKREFAEFMRYLAEEAYPQADGVRVVMDNLNTHTKAAF
jgi:DDE superfamily endonuclease